MKIYLTILIFIYFAQISFGQNVNYDLIKYNGLNFFSTKSEIIEKLGNPKRIFEPHYECGSLSSDEQGLNYFTLEYDKIRFTGNETEQYILEQIDFENDNSIILNYGKYKLTCETELTELAEIFGNEIIKYFDNDLSDGIVIHHEKYDSGIIIYIKKGKLIRFEYWSPC
jgi:hypothetical protein